MKQSLMDLECIGGPVGCHADLDTVCGTCRTFPKTWHSHSWNCRTRGESVSAHTHACERYKADEEFVADLLPRLDEGTDIARLLASELPHSPHWHYRRLANLKAKQESPDLRQHSGGVVYFVDCESFTKIGHTFDQIAGRIKGLEGGNPFPLTLWGLVIGPVALERRFHAKFHKLRHRYEWFRLNKTARENIKRLIVLLGGNIYQAGSAEGHG